MITLHKSGHCTERLDRVPRTSLRTSISARGWRAMRTDVHETTPESLASKSFRSSSTNRDQSRPEISGFGVRVPGGAQKPRSSRCPGLLHAHCVPFMSLFGPGAASWHFILPSAGLRQVLRLIVTVRHITSLRIASLPNRRLVPTPGSPALSRISSRTGAAPDRRINVLGGTAQ